MNVNSIRAEVVIPMNTQGVVPASIAVKSIRVLTIEGLTVKEKEVLEKISKFKRGMIVGSASFCGGMVFGGLVALFTGGNVPLSGMAIGGGALFGGGVAWYKMPQIVQILLKDEYKEQMNKLFSSKLEGKLAHLTKGIENSTSFGSGDLLLAAFKVDRPELEKMKIDKPKVFNIHRLKCTLPDNAVFSLEQVEMWPTKFYESNECELRYNFWRGEFVPDYETTERVNRRIIAIVQTIIQNLNPVLNSNERLTDEESKELIKIQERLQVKITDYHESMCNNFKKIHQVFRDDILEMKINFNDLYAQSSDLKITSVLSDAQNLGSINYLNKNDNGMLDSNNIFFREKAFLEVHPLVYLNGIFQDKPFSNRSAESVVLMNDKNSLDEVEFFIRGELGRYERGDLSENLLSKRITEHLDKPLSSNFKKKMEELVAYTIQNIKLGAEGYLKKDYKK